MKIQFCFVFILAFVLGKEFFSLFSMFLVLSSNFTDSNVFYDITMKTDLFLIFDISDAMKSGTFSFWLVALTCSMFVGLSGIFPLFFMPTLTDKTSCNCTLSTLLGFSVGSIFSNVFCNLLPDVYLKLPPHFVTFLLFSGFITFFGLELLFSDSKLVHHSANKSVSTSCAYLNLLANGLDNFAHGLSVGGSFLLSPRVGFTNTICILMHEIPHEIGDFAILLHADFSIKESVIGQMLTASTGILGTALTLFLGENILGSTFPAAIACFTGGGFLHVALMSILPSITQGRTFWESSSSMGGIFLGVAFTTIFVCHG